MPASVLCYLFLLGPTGPGSARGKHSAEEEMQSSVIPGQFTLFQRLIFPGSLNKISKVLGMETKTYVRRPRNSPHPVTALVLGPTARHVCSAPHLVTDVILRPTVPRVLCTSPNHSPCPEIHCVTYALHLAQSQPLP